MANNNNPVMVTYMTRTSLFYRGYIAMQSSEFSFKGVCSYILLSCNVGRQN